MTREEIIERLGRVGVGGNATQADIKDDYDTLEAAIAELRKVGKTCDNFIPRDETKIHLDHRFRWSWCSVTRAQESDEGSCHCHRWEAKS